MSAETTARNYCNEHARYKKGDKVLCYEPDPVKQPIIYYSTIQEVKHQDISEYLEEEELNKITGKRVDNPAIQPTYLVHFQNWGSRNDRWVTEDLILPINTANLVVKEELDSQIVGYKKKGRVPRKNPETKASSATPTDILDPKYKMKLALPPTIKLALERDFVNVTLRNLLINLPRSPNVQTILTQFVEDSVASNPQEDVAAINEFVGGITTYFDFMLPLQLLYKEERSQYEREGFVHAARTKRQQLLQEKDGCIVAYPGYTTWASEGTPGPIQPSTLYGAEHLLRLFIKLPELLEHMEAEYLNNVSNYCTNFVSYVAVHRAEVFVEVQPYRAADLCDLR